MNYISRHDKAKNFFDMYGHPTILVNKHLVDLKAGAGFGELALMSVSEIKRMATVTSKTSCILATLTRHDFMSVMRRA